jgi:hypothetical protein
MCLIILYVDKITGVYVNGKGSVSLDVCREQHTQILTSGIAGETSGTFATFMSPGAKYGEAVATGHGRYFFLFNLLKTKRNLLYIRNQSVPRYKRFPPRLQKPFS